MARDPFQQVDQTLDGHLQVHEGLAEGVQTTDKGDGAGWLAS